MIYILFAILALLIASIILSVYILKWLSIIRQAQVLQNMSLSTIYDKEQIIADKIIENVLDSERNIRMHLNDIDNITATIDTTTLQHLSEMETIESYMKISKDTLIDICKMCGENSYANVTIGRVYGALVSKRDSGDDAVIEEVIGILGEYLND